MSQPYFIVPGTWAALRHAPREHSMSGFPPPEPDYWQVGGRLVEFLDGLGWTNISPGRRYWDTQVEGTLIQKFIWRRRLQGQWHAGWRTGGECIGHTLWQMQQLWEIDLEMGSHTHPNPADLVAIVHSHGLAPLVYGLSDPASPSIKGIISVASPTRADMEEVYTRAAAKVDRWLHIQMGGRDRFKWLGTIGTGSLGDTLGSAFGLTRGPEQATRRDRLVEHDHSEFINVANYQDRELWKPRLDYIVDEDVAY